MNAQEVFDWLLQGDVSIQYQAWRDLNGVEKPALKSSIEHSGWGARLLAMRNANGHWGRGFYQPKWISSHYTLLDLKNLGIAKDCIPVKQTLALIVRNEKGPDGGLNPSKTIKESDVCVNGMGLNYLSYFKTNSKELESIVDFLLVQQMDDGGFNCRKMRGGATHSSLHTTLSVLEGILAYEVNHYKYRLNELLLAAQASREFILLHKLFQSHRTGKTIDPRMLQLSYPSRWRYDILRALDYFQFAGIPYDDRMEEAIDVLLKKRKQDGRWKLQAAHPGLTHFEMERVGEPSRWNTLRALRVLKHFGLSR